MPPMSFAKTFGENLRAARLALGLTQEELASRCNLHPTAVSLLERGQRVPRADTQLKLADVLKTTPSALSAGLRWDEHSSDFVEASPA
jgi:transcriptional regulator with XRE-family HTH domain